MLEISNAGLACPLCHSPVEPKNEALRCTSRRCREEYRFFHGVPVLVPAFGVKRKPQVPLSLVQDFVRLLALPDGESELKTARDILSHDISFPELGMTIEGRQFVHRVKNSLPGAWPEQLNQLIERDEDRNSANANADSDVRYRWTKCYFPKRVRPKQIFSVNCRITNTGRTLLKSDGPGRLRASAHWINCRGKAAETLRTDLLVDVQPNLSLTFPVLLEAPAEPGSYVLRLALIREDVRWFIDDAYVTELMVTTDEETPPLCVPEPGLPGYYDDHKRGIAMLQRWVKEQFTSEPFTVEIGGNFTPCTAAAGLSGFVNVDIDAPGLAFAQLKRNEGPTRVLNICANGCALPFPNGHLDLVVFFATLHHFANPDQVLRHVKSKLRRHGRLALLCEPVGHVFRETMPDDYHAELLKGLNEQSFSVEEYAMIFEQSGFKVVEIAIEAGSLKALLASANEP